jgi:hypothetical protein
VRVSSELRGVLQTFGNAALGVALGLGVLGVGFFLSQLTAPRASSAATPSPVVTQTTTIAPTVSPDSSPTPTPAPSATSAPPVVSAYTNSGRRYAAIKAPVGYVFSAPFAGTVQIQLYQFIDGEVRVGSNVPSLPFFPYVTLAGSDRRVVFRPGALDRDTQLVAQDGARVAAGAALFKTIGDGASSWSTFYDANVTANVIASLVALPGETELDAVALFAPR